MVCRYPTLMTSSYSSERAVRAASETSSVTMTTSLAVVPACERRKKEEDRKKKERERESKEQKEMKKKIEEMKRR